MHAASQLNSNDRLQKYESPFKKSLILIIQIASYFDLIDPSYVIAIVFDRQSSVFDRPLACLVGAHCIWWLREMS